MMDTDTLLVIECMEKALFNGIKHFDKQGNLLSTPLEICKTLLKEGCIRLEEQKKEAKAGQ